MNLERMKQAAIRHFNQESDKEPVYAVICTDGDMLPANDYEEAVETLDYLIASRDGAVDVTADNCPHNWEYGIVRVDVQRRTAQEDSTQ